MPGFGVVGNATGFKSILRSASVISDHLMKNLGAELEEVNGITASLQTVSLNIRPAFHCSPVQDLFDGLSFGPPHDFASPRSGW